MSGFTSNTLPDMSWGLHNQSLWHFLNQNLEIAFCSNFQINSSVKVDYTSVVTLFITGPVYLVDMMKVHSK